MIAQISTDFNWLVARTWRWASDTMIVFIFEIRVKGEEERFVNKQSVWLCVIFIAIGAAPTLAQSDYQKFEVFGGYTYSRVNSSTKAQNVVISGEGSLNITDICSSAFTEDIGPNFQHQFYCRRRGFNGFDGSAVYNFSRYFGIKTDVTGSYKSDRIVDTGGGVTTTVTTHEHLYNFLGGVQIKNNGVDARVKPFAHALAGAARYSATIDQVVQPFTAFNAGLRDNFTSFAMKLGGGLDLRAGRRIDIRVVEVDYNPIFSRNRALQIASGPFTISTTGRTMNNVSLSFGIVIH